MGIFFAYILKSSICLVVFYLFYRLLLSRETFHRFNRMALLCILLLATFLPLVEVSLPRQAEMHNTVMTLEQWLLLADTMNSSSVSALSSDSTITWIQVALFLYLIGFLFIVFYNSFSLFHLSRLLSSGKKYKLTLKDGSLVLFPFKKGDNVKAISWGETKAMPSIGDVRATLILHDLNIAPFSWMHFIVISQKDLEESGKEILIHELAHVRFCHSWDLLIADICIFVQWFNPASWLLKHELQSIHEYEADERVLEEGVDAKQYQLLLIKKAVGTRLYSMANNFNHSKLKKRISMMLKEKSAPWNRLKVFYLLPLMAVMLVAFSRPEIAEKVTEVSDAKVGDLANLVEAPFSANSAEAPIENQTIKSVPIEALSDTVVQMPEFPGGMSSLMNYFANNMRYPESAKKNKIQGRVVVQFIVDSKGRVKQAKVLRSVNEDMDAEALRLVNSMPRWKPGREKGRVMDMKLTVPVVFKMSEEAQNHSEKMKDAGESVVVRNAFSGTPPIFVIDDKEVKREEIDKLDPDRIESVSVLKGATAIAQYGERGKNGVVILTLKGKKEAGDVIVEGVVQDEQGEPVIGATILLKGTNIGTITNVKGHFKIRATEGIPLVVSYINMKTVVVKAASQIVVTLKEE